ncbi:MAG: anti-sigma factor antagonist [Clostridiales bacterium]|nr:anti-sigma factor antagonist [Clostridiales bacterium]MDY4655046.1 anti-sigma factor antagonist [Eubacteriales bacterium]
MKVSAKINRDNLYIFLEGEIDQSVAGELRVKLDDYLNSVKVKNVILNMKELTFMDSTGVGLIMGRYKKLKQNNVSMFINEPNKQIDKVLKVSGLYSIIPLI